MLRYHVSLYTHPPLCHNAETHIYHFDLAMHDISNILPIYLTEIPIAHQTSPHLVDVHSNDDIDDHRHCASSVAHNIVVDRCHENYPIRPPMKMKTILFLPMTLVVMCSKISPPSLNELPIFIVNPSTTSMNLSKISSFCITTYDIVVF